MAITQKRKCLPINISPKVFNWDFFFFFSSVSVEGKNQYDTNSEDVFNRSQHAQSRLEKKRAVGGRLEYDSNRGELLNYPCTQATRLSLSSRTLRSVS